LWIIGRIIQSLNTHFAMQRILSICLFILVFLYVANAQTKLRENQYEGYVILEDSSRMEVIIEVEDNTYPWAYQQDILFFDTSKATGVRVKREEKKYCLPGEYIEYGFNGRRFVAIQYYVKSKGEDNAITTAIGKFKNEKNTDFFAEVMREGQVSLLKFYIPPVISDEDYDDPTIIQDYIKDSENSYDILLLKGDMPAKPIQDADFDSYFKGCAFVLKKYEEGRYTLKPSKGLKGLLSSNALSGQKLMQAAERIVNDFDQRCGK
jgi:hypothetical protein